MLVGRCSLFLRANPEGQVYTAGTGLMKFVLDQAQKVFLHPVAGKLVGAAKDNGIFFFPQKGDGINPQREGVLWKSGFDMGFNFFPDGILHGSSWTETRVGFIVNELKDGFALLFVNDSVMCGFLHEARNSVKGYEGNKLVIRRYVIDTGQT